MSEESRKRVAALFARNAPLREAIQNAIESKRLPETFGAVDANALLAELAGKRSAALEGIDRTSMQLEAIVRRVGRPPLLVAGGRIVLDDLKTDLTDLPPDIGGLLKGIEPWVDSVGRVEFINHTMAWGGTGWVVERKGELGLVVTNRHVAALLARRQADGTGVFLRSPVTGVLYGAQIDFNEEIGATPLQARAAPVTEIRYLADDAAADVAILAIRVPAGAGWDPSPILLAEVEADHSDLVAVVGFPAWDSRNDANDMARYFKDLYEVKRVAPGRVIKPTAAAVLSHDCTTLGGNSGSVLLGLECRKAVGLHFAGEYGISNSAVGVTTLKGLLAGQTTGVRARPGLSAGMAAKKDEARADGVHDATHFDGREGFNETFLGSSPALATRWPSIDEAVTGALAVPSDASPEKPQELRYQHFGVKFSATRGVPVVTAVNIDGEKPIRIKRANDKWFFDGRIPLDLQHGQKAYADRSIDRGHMVRREDPNWGDQAVAGMANGDTFHYTNATPQHARLNEGKTLWQGLENYILDSTRTHGFRANVFTGPVLRADDPDLADSFKVPLEFWKVVAMAANDTGSALHVTAYLLSQGQLIRQLLEARAAAGIHTEAVEGFVLGPYRTFQIAVADLEKATGLDFGDLRQADAFAKQAKSEAVVSRTMPMVRPLGVLEDILL